MKDLPRIDRSNGRARLIVDGKPWVGLGAELRNSSASSVRYMADIWPKLGAMHCNTVCMPVYWELVEPEEGRFDFSLVRGLLDGARNNGLRLIPLWFGTWKNAISSYAPAWVKQDPARFPRAELEPGVPSLAVSAFGEEARKADARAFARFMKFLREEDQAHTAIMVQVENETGLLGASRDRSAAAESAFAQAVPPDLIEPLRALGADLHEDIRAAWDAAGRRASGSWAQVFGAAADEVFMAWHIARYVQTVAAAGSKEHPLPLFVNAWLSSNDAAGPGSGGAKPGEYPSGGPVARTHDIWRIAAPSIFALAPDIYAPDFKAICANFDRGGNPLVIPEALPAAAAANVFWALAEHGALLFAPFGIDGTHPWGDAVLPTAAPGLAESYALLEAMMPVIEPLQGTGQIRGILQTGDGPDILRLGNLEIEVAYPVKLAETKQPACGLIACTGDLEFLIAGCGFNARFRMPEGHSGKVDFLLLEDGEFREGKWQPDRRLNGDDIWGGFVRLETEAHPVVRRARLYTFG